MSPYSTLNHDKTKSPFRSFFISLTLLCVGCATATETLSPGGSPNYTPYQNEKGETIYRSVDPYPLAKPPSTAPGFPNLAPSFLWTESKPDSELSGTDTEEKAPDGEGYWSIGVELSRGGNNWHFGGILAREFGFLDARVGLSLFKGSDIYAGFDLGLRPKLKIQEWVSLFGGGGLYGGDSKACRYEFGTEVCEKKFLFAGYVEAGVELAQLTFFIRHYNIEEAGKQIPNKSFYGIGWQTKF